MAPGRRRRHPYSSTEQSNEEVDVNISCTNHQRELAILSCCRNSKNNKSPNILDHNSKNNNKISLGRVVFLGVLCAFAAVMAFLAHQILSSSETQVAEQQFQSIAERALHEAQHVTLTKRLGGVSLASVVAFAAPNVSSWPFVAIEGFEDIARNLIETVSGGDIGLVPFVRPEQLSEFEKHAYDYYEIYREPPFPNGTAVSSFGRGVWEVDRSPNTTAPDRRKRVIDGRVSYPTPIPNLIAPILHHSRGPHGVLLRNMRQDDYRGYAMDKMIQCANTRFNSSIPCDVLTEIRYNPTGNIASPLSIILHPIFPPRSSNSSNNTTTSTLTGFIGSSILWQDVLESGFSNQVRGIDCVLTSSDGSSSNFTYTVTDGQANLKGQGDLHDPSFDRYVVSINLTSDRYFTNTSTSFSLSMYPTAAFFNVYRTSNATVATVGALLIVVLISLLFLVYDGCVRHDINSKAELLRAKRQFLRFISHEIRTPMNSVCTGLTLLREEIASTISGWRDDETRGPTNLTSAAERIEQSSNGSQDFSCSKPVADEKKVQSWSTLAGEIQSSALGAVVILDELLNYDKIASGTLSLEFTVWSIWELIQHTTGEFQLPARTKGLHLQVQYNPAEVDPKSLDFAENTNQNLAVADKVRVTQCVRNLISNAIKFTSAGGTVTVRAEKKERRSDNPKSKKTNETTRFELQNKEEIVCQCSGMVELSVSDSGAGMSPDQMARVFQAGVQFNVNELQVGQGSGLGLYITKGIVEQHQGTLTVASDGLGKGTTFTMTLPLYEVPGEQTASASFVKDEAVEQRRDCGEKLRAVESATTSFEKEAAQLRILVVDDAVLNRKLLSRLLTNRGHIVDLAENGQIAVELASEAITNKQPYHTVLMDYEMPVMNGPNAASEMRALGCDSFIVGITGNLLLEDVNLFKSKGANAVLGKPVVISDLETLWMEYGVVGD